jgi:hypothetical protein
MVSLLDIPCKGFGKQDGRNSVDFEGVFTHAEIGLTVRLFWQCSVGNQDNINQSLCRYPVDGGFDG